MKRFQLQFGLIQLSESFDFAIDIVNEIFNTKICIEDLKQMIFVINFDHLSHLHFETLHLLRLVFE